MLETDDTLQEFYNQAFHLGVNRSKRSPRLIESILNAEVERLARKYSRKAIQQQVMKGYIDGYKSQNKNP